MGTLIFVCPITGSKFPLALKSIDPLTVACRGRTTATSFIVVGRTTPLSRVWASLDSNVAEITVSNAIPRVASSPIIDTHT